MPQTRAQSGVPPKSVLTHLGNVDYFIDTLVGEPNASTQPLSAAVGVIAPGLLRRPSKKISARLAPLRSLRSPHQSPKPARRGLPMPLQVLVVIALAPSRAAPPQEPRMALSFQILNRAWMDIPTELLTLIVTQPLFGMAQRKAISKAVLLQRLYRWNLIMAASYSRILA